MMHFEILEDLIPVAQVLRAAVRRPPPPDRSNADRVMLDPAGLLL